MRGFRMPGKTLLGVHRLWDAKKGRTVLMLVERVDGKRRVSFNSNPRFVFHHSPPGRLAEGEWPAAVALDRTERCETRWDDMPGRIAELARGRIPAGDLAELEKLAKRTTRGGLSRGLHRFPWLHGTDVDFEDFHHDVWLERNKDDPGRDAKLRRAFWDVEVDMGGFRGFPDPEKAPCPINAISLCRETPDGGHVLEGFLLDRPVLPNAEADGFFKDWDAAGARLLRGVADELDPRPDSVRLYAFDDELRMIMAFLRVVHDDEAGPDVLLAWNLAFDMQTLMGRIRALGGRPEDLLCAGVPPECREAWYRADDRSSDLFGKNDVWRIPSKVAHSDMMMNYLRIRMGQGRLESYSLNAVLRSETGTGKAEYEGELRDLCYSDYPAFVRYSLLDSHRLLLLDRTTGDLDTLREISTLTRTRLERAMTKTVSLKNLHRVFLRGRGMAMGNNRNADREGGGDFLKGGYVADPGLVAPVGDRVSDDPALEDRRSNHLFSDVCDFDFSSLYPSIITAFVVDSAACAGRPALEREGEGDPVVEWAADVASGDPVLAGSRWLGLPGYSELSRQAEGTPG